MTLTLLQLSMFLNSHRQSWYHAKVMYAFNARDQVLAPTLAQTLASNDRYASFINFAGLQSFCRNAKLKPFSAYKLRDTKCHSGALYLSAIISLHIKNCFGDKRYKAYCYISIRRNVLSLNIFLHLHKTK